MLIGEGMWDQCLRPVKIWYFDNILLWCGGFRGRFLGNFYSLELLLFYYAQQTKLYKQSKPKIQSGHFLLLFNSNSKCPSLLNCWLDPKWFLDSKNGSDLLYHLARFDGDCMSHASARREGLSFGCFFFVTVHAMPR